MGGTLSGTLLELRDAGAMLLTENQGGVGEPLDVACCAGVGGGAQVDGQLREAERLPGQRRQTDREVVDPLVEAFDRVGRAHQPYRQRPLA